MPNILFASNSISHFPGTEARNDAWSYDSARVPYSIFCPPATVAGSPLFDATTGDETWFHFTYGSDLFSTSIQDKMFEITDVDGNVLVSMTYQDSESFGGYRATFNAGAQTIEETRFLPMLNSSYRTYDIQVLFTDVLAECRIYVNEILLFEISFSVVAREYPRFLLIGGHTGPNDAYGAYLSEIIIADGDTRNARLNLLRPASGGFYDDWTGAISALSDDDPTTGMTTLIANQTQSTILTPYTGADNISNIVQVTTSVRGQNSPANMQHLIRMSGVDYFTGNFAVPFAKDYQVTDWTLNPATSIPWVASDLDVAEFGFKSIT